MGPYDLRRMVIGHEVDKHQELGREDSVMKGDIMEAKMTSRTVSSVLSSFRTKASDLVSSRIPWRRICKAVIRPRQEAREVARESQAFKSMPHTLT